MGGKSCHTPRTVSACPLGTLGQSEFGPCFLVTAPITGLFVRGELCTCDPVKKGRLLGHIISDIDLRTREIRSSATGYLRVYGASRANCDVAMLGHHPYVDKGECVATVMFRKKMR